MNGDREGGEQAAQQPVTAKRAVNALIRGLYPDRDFRVVHTESGSIDKFAVIETAPSRRLLAEVTIYG
jgi:hypothetical protein